MRLILSLLFVLFASPAFAQTGYGKIVYPTPLRDFLFGGYVAAVQPVQPYRPPAYQPPTYQPYRYEPVPPIAYQPVAPIYPYPYPRIGSATWQLVPLKK